MNWKALYQKKISFNFMCQNFSNRKYEKESFFKNYYSTSLKKEGKDFCLVPWLSLHAFTAEGMGLVLGTLCREVPHVPRCRQKIFFNKSKKIKKEGKLK